MLPLASHVQAPQITVKWIGLFLRVVLTEKLVVGTTTVEWKPVVALPYNRIIVAFCSEYSTPCLMLYCGESCLIIHGVLLCSIRYCPILATAQGWAGRP